jgi:carboxyl-terminal processing protease
MRRRVTILVLGIVMILVGFKSSNEYFEVSKNLDIFSEVYKTINTGYVDDVKPGKLVREAIDGMLNSLDPYTNFYSEAQAEDYMFQVTGSYGGIGASIKTRNGENVIVRTYQGFPAAESGLRAGDIIKYVDGKEVKGLNSKELTELLKGTAGTDVVLKVDRPGVGSMEKTVKRAEVKVKNVPYYGKIDAQTGYIQLTGFTPNAGKEVKDALVDLKKQGITQVILDLRGNGGGLLHEAVNIVNVFVDKGETIVKTIGRGEQNNRTYKTLKAPIDTDIPLAVLVDKGSASASEIVSGAIQDLDRGVVIGQKSFGKGLVQGTKRLSYNTQMKYTTAKYYIPSGRCVQKLDYAHKKNGKAVQVADSLKRIFHTKNKRPVWDGDGVTPDILLAEKEYSKLVSSLIQNDLIFDFATDFRNKVDSIPVPLKFELSDSDYASFRTFISDKDYAYETDTEKAIEALKKRAKDEGYKNNLMAELETLEKAMSDTKKQDMNTYKEDIMQLLEREVASRYYFDRALVEVTFDDDQEILKALEVLKDSGAYAGILSGE